MRGPRRPDFAGRGRARKLVLAVAAVAAAASPARAQVPGADADRGVAARSDWRAGAVCYEVFVRSFFDSDGDGIGDLAGLVARLDYLNDGDPATRDDLGVRCLWLMPIMPAGSYHGYDVTDFYRVDPRYGTEEDFRRLVEEAHARGIRVIVDMLINHVSDEHPWFRHAALYPDSPWRDWFRWADEPGPPNEWGGDNWHRSPYRDEWYYGFFWRTMPDLDWETPAVREEMKRVAEHWLLDMGADGLRLDAVRHLMEDPVTGTATNVPRTHDMMREYGGYVRSIAPDAFTIGEVFDSSAALLPYYPDQLDAYFAFEVSDGILDAVRTGSGRGLIASVLELQAVASPDRWALFLRNHDQPRTLTVLEGDVARAKLAASLLLTLPGLPFVYYGEEIGMTGDKPDRRIRTPMPWAIGPAAGFTTGLPWEPLHPDSLTANVAAQEDDPGSLLHHYRALIHLRGASRALGAGRLVPLDAGTEAVAAWLRVAEDDVALVVANLGETPLEAVSVSSEPGALSPGSWRTVPLLGEADSTAFEVGSDGRIDGLVPAHAIPPREALVFDLVSTRGPKGTP